MYIFLYPHYFSYKPHPFVCVWIAKSNDNFNVYFSSLFFCVRLFAFAWCGDWISLKSLRITCNGLVREAGVALAVILMATCVCMFFLFYVYTSLLFVCVCLCVFFARCLFFIWCDCAFVNLFQNERVWTFLTSESETLEIYESCRTRSKINEEKDSSWNKEKESHLPLVTDKTNPVERNTK